MCSRFSACFHSHLSRRNVVTLPLLTRRISAQGAIVEVTVTVSAMDLLAPKVERRPLLPHQRILALADTGANRTCLDPSVLQALDLEPAGTVQVSTPLAEAFGPRSAYKVALVIPARVLGESPLVFDTLEVVATELQRRFGVQALLGRDVLERCLLVYHGPERRFTLAY